MERAYPSIAAMTLPDSSLFAAAIADRRFLAALAIAALSGLVRGFSGLSNLQVGFVSAIPNLVAVVAMVIVAAHSEGNGLEQLKSVDPQEAFSWRAGRLVYRGEPLSEVVATSGDWRDGPVTVTVTPGTTSPA